LDLNEMAGFNKGMSGLVSELIKLNSSEMQKTAAAAKAAQTFYHSDYKDLGDFLAKIDRQAMAPTQRMFIGRIRNSLSKLVISNDVSPSIKATGLALWLPLTTSQYSGQADRYRGLEFAKETGWGEFLKLLVGR
jgi:hypothetical protein